MTRSLLALLFLAGPAFADAPYAMINGPNGTVKVSLFSAQGASLPVAQVEDRVVTLRELEEALAVVHGSHQAAGKAGKKDFHPVLDRLIGARLVALEAHEMGLDELPEVKKAVEIFAIGERREAVRKRLVRDVNADPETVARYFRAAVREWKLRSLLFAKEADAREMSAALKSGKPWDDLAAKAAAAKKAESSISGDYVSAKKMLPQVAAAADGLLGGQASEPVQVPEGWAIFRVDDLRYPENPQARSAAEARALDEARNKAMASAYDGLVKKFAKVDAQLLEKLDFEAKKPGFARLERDQRALARLENGTTITVADLAKVLRTNFFHGVDDAVRLKRVNSFRYGTFNKMLYRAIFDLVAEKERIAESDEYKRAVADYKEGIVFDEFVRRALMGEVKVTEEEGQAYYAQHKAEFSYPAFYTLDCLSFQSARAAESALAKLKAGTDFKWLKSNADGQVPEEKRNLDLGAGTVSASSLPQGLAAQLAGARPGDLRLFSQEGQHHVVLVRQSTPSKERPYLELRADIAKVLSGQKLNVAIQDWIAKLRKAHDVKVYLSQIGT